MALHGTALHAATLFWQRIYAEVRCTCCGSCSGHQEIRNNSKRSSYAPQLHKRSSSVPTNTHRYRTCATIAVGASQKLYIRRTCQCAISASYALHLPQVHYITEKTKTAYHALARKLTVLMPLFLPRYKCESSSPSYTCLQEMERMH